MSIEKEKLTEGLTSPWEGGAVPATWERHKLQDKRSLLWTSNLRKSSPQRPGSMKAPLAKPPRQDDKSTQARKMLTNEKDYVKPLRFGVPVKSFPTIAMINNNTVSWAVVSFYWPSVGTCIIATPRIPTSIFNKIGCA